MKIRRNTTLSHEPHELCIGDTGHMDLFRVWQNTTASGGTDVPMDGPLRGRREFSSLLPLIFQLRSCNWDSAAAQASPQCCCKWEQQLLSRLQGVSESSIRTIHCLMWQAGCGMWAHSPAPLWQITHPWAGPELSPLQLIIGAGKMGPREAPSEQPGKKAPWKLREWEGSLHEFCSCSSSKANWSSCSLPSREFCSSVSKFLWVSLNGGVLWRRL